MTTFALNFVFILLPMCLWLCAGAGERVPRPQGQREVCDQPAVWGQAEAGPVPHHHPTPTEEGEEEEEQEEGEEGQEGQKEQEEKEQQGIERERKLGNRTEDWMFVRMNDESKKVCSFFFFSIYYICVKENK